MARDTRPSRLRRAGVKPDSDHPHYMLKEIYEQPEALRHFGPRRRNGNGRLGGMQLTAKQLRTVPHVRLLGCGTALNAALIGQQLIERLARIPAVAHVSSEFRYQDLVTPEALHFAVSQSGETMTPSPPSRKSNSKVGTCMGSTWSVPPSLGFVAKAFTSTLDLNNRWLPPKPSPTWSLR